MSDEMDDGSAASAFFGLVLPFEDPSPSFVHGFGAGMVWQAMEKGEETIGGVDGLPMHSANIALFRGMAAVRGYDLELQATAYPEWTYATFKRRGRARLSLVGGGA